MLARCWGIVGLVVALASGQVFGQEQAKPDPSEQTDQSSGESSRPPFPVVIVQAHDDTAHEQERESKSDAHEAADLVAQQQAALAAERAAIATERQLDPIWASVILSAVAALTSAGALVIGLLTQKSVDRTSRAELRAYVGIGKINLQIAPDATSITANIEVVNSGQTPAKNVRVGGGWAIEKPSFEPPPSEISSDGSRGTVGAGDVVYINVLSSPATNLDFQASELAEALKEKGTHRYWVYGKIMYEDVFKTTHWTTFRYQLGKTGTLSPTMSPTQTGNDTD